MARLLEEAGCPPGVVNVVPADRDVSEYLVTHPGVDKVTFTGSSAVGRRIAAACGHDLRHVTLELGGKSAAVVLDDADLEQTVSALRLGSFRNNGQVCTLKTRLVVPAALAGRVRRPPERAARLDAHRRPPRRDHADRPPGQCAPARARGGLHRDRPEGRCAAGPRWRTARHGSRLVRRADRVRRRRPRRHHRPAGDLRTGGRRDPLHQRGRGDQRSRTTRPTASTAPSSPPTSTGACA